MIFMYYTVFDQSKFVSRIKSDKLLVRYEDERITFNILKGRVLGVTSNKIILQIADQVDGLLTQGSIKYLTNTLKPYGDLPFYEESNTFEVPYSKKKKLGEFGMIGKAFLEAILSDLSLDLSD